MLNYVIIKPSLKYVVVLYQTLKVYKEVIYFQIIIVSLKVITKSRMAVESTKMTRNQVHQKIKANFQALCTRCPQLVRKS